MDDAGERLLAALSTLDELARSLSPEQAATTVDAADLQVFWRDWPDTSAWAAALWRTLNEDLEQPASKQSDPELDEVGGPG